MLLKHFEFWKGSKHWVKNLNFLAIFNFRHYCSLISTLNFYMIYFDNVIGIKFVLSAWKGLPEFGFKNILSFAWGIKLEFKIFVVFCQLFSIFDNIFLWLHPIIFIISLWKCSCYTSLNRCMIKTFSLLIPPDGRGRLLSAF